MLSVWLAFSAVLACSVNPRRTAVTVSPTYSFKGHLEKELTLECGTGNNTGFVLYWHTPFGELQTPGSLSKTDPVFLHHDLSLVVPNISSVHGGLYYCLLQHAEGIKIWPYELHVTHNPQKNQDHRRHDHNSSRDTPRFRGDIQSKAEREAGFSNAHFAGIVSASVLLTFVLGFTAGALSRTHVLRCLNAVHTCLLTTKNQHQEHTSGVNLSPMMTTDGNEAFEMKSVTALTPPPKPQRSFRNRPQDEQETTANLDRYGYTAEEKVIEKEESERSLLKSNKWCGGEKKEGEKEENFYLSEERVGPTEENSMKKGMEKDGRDGTEEKGKWRQEKKVEKGEQDRFSKEVARMFKGEEKLEGDMEEEEGDKIKERKKLGKGREVEDMETDLCSRTESKKQDTKESGTENTNVSSPPQSCHHARVIWLYQYDEEGRRYSHLPEPTMNAPCCPNLGPKHRSVSLSRLNAIMAAASAELLDTRGKKGGEATLQHGDMTDTDS